MTAHTDFDHALGRFQPVSAPAITDAEFAARQGALQQSMRREGVAAVWLDASTSLVYFLGHALGRSERIHGALIFAQGEPLHVSPTFEAPKLRSLLRNGLREAALTGPVNPSVSTAPVWAGRIRVTCGSTPPDIGRSECDR